MARFTGSVRRNCSIKGTIGGGGGKGNLKGRRPGTGDLTSTNTTTTPTPTTRVITDPVTQTRDKGGAFTQEGWVNVPGGRVFVRPGDTMSEAIGQGKGLQVIAKTERARSAGGAYTQGGYVKTNESGKFSVASVRAGDTRSEVINMARARAGRSLGSGNGRQAAAAQQRSLVSFRAGERSSSAASARGAATPASRGVTARSTTVSRSTAGARAVVTSTGARATTTAAARPSATRAAVKKAPVRRVSAPAVRRGTR